MSGILGLRVMVATVDLLPILLTEIPEIMGRQELGI